MQKIASVFEKVVGTEANRPEAVEYKGSKYIIGRTGQYPQDIEDLLFYYPLVTKLVVKEHLDSIAVSLPAETFLHDMLGSRRFISKLEQSIKEEVPVDKVIILPQGAITLYKIYKDNYLQPDNTLVIDGGFNTVNICLVNARNEMYYSKTYYNEIGIRNLLEKYFLHLVQLKYPEVSANLQLLKRDFLRGYMEKGLKRIDVSEEKKEAVKIFIEDTFSRIVKDLERSHLSFEQFVVVGGLAHYLPQEIETSKKYFIPKINPEYYNVLGMLAFSGTISIDFGFGDIKIAGDNI